MSFSDREFRNSLGQFATGVCLVSAKDEEGIPHAVTVNSFSSVSLSPPLVLWSIQKEANTYDLFLSANNFAISILSASQQELSVAYAQKDGHVLEPQHYQTGSNGAPLIDGAIAAFECTLERVLEGGDHTILLGRVTAVHDAPGQEPLVFFAGKYRSLS
ncbi:MAG: flavin reductase family protein [Pseudomonadota bacterium]